MAAQQGQVIPHLTPTTHWARSIGTLAWLQESVYSCSSQNISLELTYCATPGNSPYESLARRVYMFWFLFCSSFIRCAFLSHNVIWKQFLPTAGSAFTIVKHVKWKTVEDAETRSGAASPPCLARVLRLIWGLRTSLIKTQSVFKQASLITFPSSEGQHVLWGRNFLNALQIKLIRCRPNRQLPRSAGSMWRPAHQPSRIFPAFPHLPAASISGSPGRSPQEHGFPVLLPPTPIQGEPEPKKTKWVIKGDHPLKVILRNKFACRLKLETCPVLERQGPGTQLSARGWLAPSLLSAPRDQRFTSMANSGPENPGAHVNWNTV